jgi:glycosyltransferase involved in cell wall biosynthesis
MYLLRLVNYLSTKHSWDLHVLCKSGRAGSLEPDFIKAGAVIHPLKQGYLDPIGWRRFRTLLRKERYDTVCDFTGNFAGMSVLLAERAHVPTRIAFFRQTKEFFKPTIARLLYWRASRFLVKRYATVILSNSRTGITNLLAEKAEDLPVPCAVVPNGIQWADSSLLASWPEDTVRRELNLPIATPIIGHVGRYLPEKNHGAILDVAEYFAKRGSTAVFLLVGRDVEKHLGSGVKQRGLNNVRFAGERRDVLQLITLMNAFYFPSMSEGQPNALLEAVASGVPFVASDIPEIQSCFPECWGAKWLVAAADTDSAAELLLEHTSRATPADNSFRELVAWVRENNGQAKRFGEVAEFLRGKL